MNSLVKKLTPKLKRKKRRHLGEFDICPSDNSSCQVRTFNLFHDVVVKFKKKSVLTYSCQKLGKKIFWGDYTTKL